MSCSRPPSEERAGQRQRVSLPERRGAGPASAGGGRRAGALPVRSRTTSPAGKPFARRSVEDILCPAPRSLKRDTRGGATRSQSDVALPSLTQGCNSPRATPPQLPPPADPAVMTVEVPASAARPPLSTLGSEAMLGEYPELTGSLSGTDRSAHALASDDYGDDGDSTSAGAAAGLDIDDDDEDGEGGEAGEWAFVAPPDNHRTFYFPEDDIEFSSEFDSGNLIQVERKGAFQYHMYSSMDCGNAPTQTNNRQWFHFSVRGGARGATVMVTFVGMLRATMFTYDWMPVMCLQPSAPRPPQYTRVPGCAVVVPMESVPPTPGYPALVYRDPKTGDASGGGGDDDGGDDDDLGAGDEASSSSPVGGVLTFGPPRKAKRKAKKKPLAMNLSFEFRIDADLPIARALPLGDPETPALYIASNHPYSYAHLQRSIAGWEYCARHGRNPSHASLAAAAAAAAVAAEGSSGAEPTGLRSVFFHREVLCQSLEGRSVDLLTITDSSGMLSERMPLIAPLEGVPHSAARDGVPRPPWFADKPYVVLSARVHSGECPGSHMMHGAIDFLLNPRDPRAQMLRQRFVFVVVPMLNPDGVVRGHSRVDAAGEDLNRTYRDPSFQRHPSTFALWHLLMQLADMRKLCVYVDMHAHANKKGTFLYGNGMPAQDQVQNLLYGKLVSLNTPYFDFRACNYSESNMFAVGKGGRSKDSSCRVVLYQRTGLLHSYAIETSHVAAKNLNALSTLTGVDELEVAPGMLGFHHTPATFADTGKALLVALLDLKGLNPVSRVPLGSYHSTRGLSMHLHRQLQIEAAEKLFALAYKKCADRGETVISDGTQSQLAAYMSTLLPCDYPEKLTVRDSKVLPPVTFSGIAAFLSTETAVLVLSQTPPPGMPRSLVSSTVPRRTPVGSPNTAAESNAAGAPGKRSASRASRSHSSDGR